MESTQLSPSLHVNKAIPVHLETVPRAPSHQSEVLRIPVPEWVQLMHSLFSLFRSQEPAVP